jgi:NADPH2:quinone reductase
MRAVQVVTTTGPEGVETRDVPEPVVGPGEVLIDVRAVGVTYPDLLLSRGLYQIRPDPPFTLGGDVAGVVVSGEGFTAGQRVAAVMPNGGAAERVAVARGHVYPLPDEVSFAEGAALPINYFTAEFALARRAGLRPGETVLVLGAAGGVGTAALQVAKALGARTIAVVLDAAQVEFARAVGADEVVLSDGFKDATLELTDGRGVDVVVDVLGGDGFLDALRTLAPFGRLLVIGFADGQKIPTLKVNRLLLKNVDVRGVAWGGYSWDRPAEVAEQWKRLVAMIEAGTVRPAIGGTYRLEDYPKALNDIAERRSLGKLVVTFG